MEARVVDDPECSDIPVSPEEIRQAVWERPTPTPIPNPGERCLFRLKEHGDIEDALVVEVQDPREPEARRDPYVWRRDNLSGEPTSMQPNAWVQLILHTSVGYVECRESRVRGAPGWLPAGWDPPPAEPAHLAAMAAGLTVPGRW
jgi:hypothetical protein